MQNSNWILSIFFLFTHALPFSPWYPLKSKGRFVNLFGIFSPLCALGVGGAFGFSVSPTDLLK